MHSVANPASGLKTADGMARRTQKDQRKKERQERGPGAEQDRNGDRDSYRGRDREEARAEKGRKEEANMRHAPPLVKTIRASSPRFGRPSGIS